MLVVPAIDLMGGKIVRLYKGDIKEATCYSFEPLEKAKEFEDLGFKRLHIVDLDAAFGKGSNIDTIKEIARHTTLECEVGGGIRNYEIATLMLDIGVKRLVIGSLPFKDKAQFEKIVSSYQNNIVIGVDVKDNIVQISGWVESANVDIISFLSQMKSFGITEAIVTDISKDGTLAGIDEKFYEYIASKSELNITASGGVKSIDDIIRLNKAGVRNLVAVIVGKAIYEKTLDLSLIKGGSI